MRRCWLLLLIVACGRPHYSPAISPSLINEAWRYAYACGSVDSMGRVLDTTNWGGLHRVVIRTVNHFKNRDILGQWQGSSDPNQPDTITIVASFKDTAWVWGHEMEHHVLQDRVDPNRHPSFPFSFPCKLQVFQQRPGGIMMQRIKP